MAEPSKTDPSTTESAGALWRPSLIWTTLKAVTVIAVLSWLAANWVSSSDRVALARLAGLAGQGAVGDPLTTGSLARSAGATRLDPCALPKR